jgi:DNA replication and repair protein RecF
MAGYSGSMELLEVYDSQLVPLGNAIYRTRKEFVEELTIVFKKYYKQIAEGKEEVDLRYSSQLEQAEYEMLIRQSQKKDIAVQHTSVGIHKDDLELSMNAVPIKKTGSQGQQKTFLVALKLAQFEFLKKVKGVTPILLLDDIFDKFDVDRVKQILKLVAHESFGQILITHTNEERMRQLLSDFHGAYSLFKVEDNRVNTIQS